MTSARMWIKWCIQGVTYAASVAFLYVALALCAFLLASVALRRGVVFSNEIMKGYQRTYYIAGMRKDWQLESQCVDFDPDLLYKPRTGTCVFENPEFKTTLNFDEEGRISQGKNARAGIAMIGDSFTMGWGVNDDETYSALLERMAGRPVYNLGVSSYATYRELRRLQKSGLLERVDTVVIQHCENDLEENLAHGLKSHSELHGRYTRGRFVSLMGFNAPRVPPQVWKVWMLSALKIPILWVRDRVTNSGRELYESYELYPHYRNFAAHHSALGRILEKFPELAGKRVVVFYINGRGSKFDDFLQVTKQNHLPYVSFAELDLEPELFFKVDDHLTKQGNYVVAQRLLPYISGPRKPDQGSSL